MAIRTKVAAMRARDPEMTASEIARVLGVSRARVGQLLLALGLPTRTGRSAAARGPIVERGPQSRVITGGVALRITATTAGTIGELLAAADLMTRGYTVYIPIARHVAYADLIALARGRPDNPLLIEVRCGNRRGDRVTYTRKAHKTVNHHAVIITGEPVTYFPPLPAA